MPLMYPIKHVYRNWKLFIALLIGIILAATFFAGIGVKANLAAKQSLDQQLKGVITDMEFQASLNLTNLALARQNITDINGVKSVDTVARFNYVPLSTSSDNYTSVLNAQMTCFPNTSRIHDEWLNKPAEGIGENQTYLLANSNLAKTLAVGDNITTIIQFPTPKYYNTTTIYLNLTVAGFAELTDTGYALVSGNSYYISPLTPSMVGDVYISYRSDIMIVGWESTLEKLWATTPDTSTVDLTFSISLDRDKLISPWDIETSANNINTIADNIQNNILANYLAHGYVNNMLGNALSSFQYNFQSTLFNFIIVSIPVFFVAWYLGSTVSDVSFNMRRREIGLLSTKGLSSGQIQRMFLTEALLIGFIGGVIGVVGGLILNQVFAGGFNLNALFDPQMFNLFTVVCTVLFGMILALLSVFWSARKAARLPAVDTLRDYMPTEIDRPYRKRLPWVAFILGTYKIIAFIIGLNVPMLLSRLSFGGGNFLLALILVPFSLLDSALNYIGPLLFFWGLTKLLIQNSLKFQQLTASISRLMGDLGALAAKNVRRNPARLAAIAFMVALIIGYSVQVTGQIASVQDYTVRQVKSQVGADVTVSVVNASRAQIIMDDIVANVSGIRNATIESTLTSTISQRYGQIAVKTIDPDSWSVSAYYEGGWFGGTSVDQALKELKASNNTIILERSVAKTYNLKLYDEIGIDFPSCPRKLRIIGFFGPEPSDSGTSPIGGFSYTVPTWSYVPRNLFNMTEGSDIYRLESFQTRILLKLQSGVNGTEVANNIRSLESLDLEIYGVDSFDEQWRQSQQMNNLYTYSSMQVLDIQRLGLVFVVLSASVGTALVAFVSLRERSREATMMSVRGLSYRQLVWMFLTENIAVITFSVVLGVVVGVIIVYGNVISANGAISALVTQRVIFPTDAVVSIGSYIALIYASMIVPILVMTSQYVTKLEKMVRLR